MISADPRLLWYVARAAGLVAWALSATTVLWGLALSTRTLGRRPKPAWLADLHQFLGGLTVVFTAVHIAALALDDYVQFTPTDLLIPFAAEWRPLAVAWGIVGLYLLLAIEVTSLLRRRIPTKLWRSVHLASFVLFATATAHLLTAGSDAAHPWLRWTVLLTVAAVVFLSAVRILTPRRAGRRVDREPRRARRNAAGHAPHLVTATRRSALAMPAGQWSSHEPGNRTPDRIISATIGVKDTSLSNATCSRSKPCHDGVGRRRRIGTDQRRGG